MVDELLENSFVDDANRGAEMLIKGPTGWTHKFANDGNRKCKICEEVPEEHSEYKMNIVQQKAVSYFYKEELP
jgi:hypothetical protein